MSKELLVEGKKPSAQILWRFGCSLVSSRSTDYSSADSGAFESPACSYDCSSAVISWTGGIDWVYLEKPILFWLWLWLTTSSRNCYISNDGNQPPYFFPLSTLNIRYIMPLKLIYKHLAGYYVSLSCHLLNTNTLTPPLTLQFKYESLNQIDNVTNQHFSIGKMSFFFSFFF